jgi:hypothetical protein
MAGSSHVHRWSYGEFKDLPEEKRRCPLGLESVESYVLRKRAPAPALHEIKDFFRFYVKQSKGRITEHATVKTTPVQAVFFFAGLTRVTGTATTEDGRKEIFKVRAVLCGSKNPS